MNRIDGLNPLSTSRTMGGQAPSNIENTDGDAAAQANASGGRQDVLALSDRGRVVGLAALAVAQSPDTRAAKVAALTAAIANGTYTSNARAIAERLMATGGLAID